MLYNEVTRTISKICQKSNLDFVEKGQVIEKLLNECDEQTFLSHLDRAGAIPECFDHDSTEEKIFAKYCDSLLARAFRYLGLDAETIENRSDAADVVARGNDYTIVGDAKAFRLSRTAKNQKDFKIEALDKWRQGADFACLVCPLYQYPNRDSQIYSQAVTYNVTLLSFTHLSFLITNKIKSHGGLRTLWEIPQSLKTGKAAKAYWTAIDKRMVELTSSSLSDWDEFVKKQYKILPELANEQIKYWEDEKIRISKLPHKQAVKELLKALKIDAKIKKIKQTTGL